MLHFLGTFCMLHCLILDVSRQVLDSVCLFHSLILAVSRQVLDSVCMYLNPLNEVTNLTKELNACTDNIKTWMLTSLNCCMSTLHLVHYALLLTPACWKSNNTNARLMASALSLALDPTFGIHSLKTLDTAQPCHLLKPN